MIVLAGINVFCPVCSGSFWSSPHRHLITNAGCKSITLPYSTAIRVTICHWKEAIFGFTYLWGAWLQILVAVVTSTLLWSDPYMCDSLAWETSNTSNMQHWSQLYNVTIWCLFCVFIFTEGAAACFWCVSHEVSSVETCLCCFYSHNKTGWADHMPSEVAARKCSHHLQRLRLCRLHHHSPPSSSSGKQGNSLIWFISWALIHWLVLLSVKCGVGGEGIGCIGNVIKGVKEPLKFILL